MSCQYFSFLPYKKKCTIVIKNVKHIIRSFDSFTVSQTVLALQTDRLLNPRIKHQNNIINLGRKNKLGDCRRTNYFSKIGTISYIFQIKCSHLIVTNAHALYACLFPLSQKYHTSPQKDFDSL